jgi:hypothetical protein
VRSNLTQSFNGVNMSKINTSPVVIYTANTPGFPPSREEIIKEARSINCFNLTLLPSVIAALSTALFFGFSQSSKENEIFWFVACAAAICLWFYLLRRSYVCVIDESVRVFIKPGEGYKLRLWAGMPTSDTTPINQVKKLIEQ